MSSIHDIKGFVVAIPALCFQSNSMDLPPYLGSNNMTPPVRMRGRKFHGNGLEISTFQCLATEKLEHQNRTNIKKVMVRDLLACGVLKSF